MPVQSTYTAEHPVAFEGQRVNFELTNTTSKVAEASDIGFGKAVVRGTKDDQAKLPTATGQDFVGVVTHTTAWTQESGQPPVYNRYREMNIIDFGKIWVITEQAVVPGDDVYFRHTAGTSPNDIVGRFRKDADTDKADQIMTATFETTSAAGGLAIIRLR